MQNVFMSIRRQKSTYFLDLKESVQVVELKKVLQGIIKVSPDSFALFDSETGKMMEDKLSLADNGLTQHNAKAQCPAQLKLVYRDGESFEPAELVDYSLPPELPDVMKTHDGAEHVEAQ